MQIHFDPALADKIKTACLLFENVQNSAHDDSLWELIYKKSEDLRQHFRSPADAVSLFEPSRQLYRKIGLDPTRRRPSSEALIRRILQNKPLYQVNTVVDAGNYCSIHFALSVGLYDMDKLGSQINLRMGQEGEGYEGINKGWINVGNRFTLADEKGPFGNPSSDSDRSKITLTTNRVLFVIYAPSGYNSDALISHMEFVTETFRRHCRASLTEKTILPE